MRDQIKEVKQSKNFKKYSLEAREKIKLAVKIQKVIKRLEKKQKQTNKNSEIVKIINTSYGAVIITQVIKLTRKFYDENKKSPRNRKSLILKSEIENWDNVKLVLELLKYD